MKTPLQSRRWFRQLYYARNDMEKTLVISSLFGLVLVIARLLITGKILFLFLPWNLFLAWTPYILSKWLIAKPSDVLKKKILVIVFGTWILIIPNSFYILTDLFHLQLREESTRWFDLTLIFSFAWTGLVLGILSVWQMGKVYRRYFPTQHEIFFIFPIMWLNALGIYIGRYMRFNSWDVITNPLSLFRDISIMVFQPIEHLITWGMICCYAVFMTIIYYSIKKMARVM
ncbi:MAG TPA: DUF1361 domain-containing protein [Chitinophagaceae bacterium]